MINADHKKSGLHMQVYTRPIQVEVTNLGQDSDTGSCHVEMTCQHDDRWRHLSIDQEVGYAYS